MYCFDAVQKTRRNVRLFSCVPGGKERVVVEGKWSTSRWRPSRQPGSAPIVAGGIPGPHGSHYVTIIRLDGWGDGEKSRERRRKW